MAKSAESEVEKMKMLEERIKAPSIWGRVPRGIRFEDLQDRRYEDSVRLLKKHYLSEEVRRHRESHKNAFPIHVGFVVYSFVG